MEYSKHLQSHEKWHANPLGQTSWDSLGEKDVSDVLCEGQHVSDFVRASIYTPHKNCYFYSDCTVQHQRVCISALHF